MNKRFAVVIRGWILPCFLLLCGMTFAQTEPVPRNVIVMISDGCGFNHILATNYYEDGEAGAERFQQTFRALAMSTFSAGGGYEPGEIWADFDACRKGATDSAAAGTAMAAGVKTSKGAIGVDRDKRPVLNMLEAAEAQGKATGVITTVPLSHATPASFVAHNASRGNYEEIAREMLCESAADVIMGAGHPEFDDNGEPVPPAETARKREGRHKYVGGTKIWQALKAGKPMADADGDGTPDAWTLVETRQAFQALVDNPPKRVVGVLPVDKTAQAGRDAQAGDPAKEAPYDTPLLESSPTLAEMASGALAVLGQDPDGLFLMVEAGAVDWTGHRNALGRMIEEQIAFHNAIDAVIDWVESNGGWERNLVIVTSDHETGYLCGPDAGPEFTYVQSKGQGEMPAVTWHSTSHTNQLVPFYVRGAGTDEFVRRAEKTDPVFGAYLDNTDVGQAVLGFFETGS